MAALFDLLDATISKVNASIKTDAQKLTEEEKAQARANIGAMPDTYEPPNQTAEQVGADPVGTAVTTVNSHNEDPEAHGDIRKALQDTIDRLNAVLNSDDETLDELSEIVDYIKSNKELIESVTTSKVGVSDIVNDLETDVSDKPLSAAQGVVLKGLVDDANESLTRTVLVDPQELSEDEKRQARANIGAMEDGAVNEDIIQQIITQRLSSFFTIGPDEPMNGPCMWFDTSHIITPHDPYYLALDRSNDAVDVSLDIGDDGYSVLNTAIPVLGDDGNSVIITITN